MNRLKMLTQEEVADYLHTHISKVSMLRELDILPAIKTGRNFMFTTEVIERFQKEYEGLDVSNKVKAMHSRDEVIRKRKENSYGNTNKT